MRMRRTYTPTYHTIPACSLVFCLSYPVVGRCPRVWGVLLVVGLSCRPVKVAVDGSGARDWYVWRSLVGKEVRGRHIRNIQNCIVSCGMVRQTPAVQTLSPYRPRKVNLPTSQEKSKNRHFFPVSSPKVRRTAAQPGP